MPKHGRRKKHNDGGFIGAARLTLGPRYSKPDGPPAADQVPGAIAASDPNSPNSIAAQSLGFQSNCGQDIKSRADALNAQIAGYQAQLNAILAKVKQDYANELACGGSPSCTLNWANQAVADASKAIPISAQVAALIPNTRPCRPKPPAAPAAARHGSAAGGHLGRRGQALWLQLAQCSGPRRFRRRLRLEQHFQRRLSPGPIEAARFPGRRR